MSNSEDSEDGIDEIGDDSRFDVCMICEKGVQDLKRHCEDEHIDQPETLEQAYPNIYDELITKESYSDTSGSSISSHSGESTTSHQSTTSEVSNSDSSTSKSSSSSSSTMGNKWYLIGIGGAGNRIVDTILMRRDSLKNTQKPLAGVWGQALAGYGLLNANLGDMMSTYYYDELNEMDENELLSTCAIGLEHDKNDFTGCGRNWDLGRKFIEKDFEGSSSPMSGGGRWDIVLDKVARSQAAMIAHSVTGGTGCGAAPVLSREIKSSDKIKSKSVFGSVIIPSEKEDGDGPLVHMNGCVGTARMAKYSDAVLVFENDKLESLNPQLDNIEGVERYPHYKDMNNALMRYFEIFSMASIDGEEVEGEDFDINDALNPINFRRPATNDYYDEDDRDGEQGLFDEPGNILAPVIARSRAESLNTSTIQTLAHNALQENLLADFDPATAWGGTFVFYGPKEKLSGKVRKKEFQDYVMEEYLDQDPEEPGLVEVNTSVINVNSLDSIYLWGFLWNPKVRSLERMRDTAATYKDANIRGAEPVQKNWDAVEGLFNLLGRENMGG